MSLNFSINEMSGFEKSDRLCLFFVKMKKHSPMVILSNFFFYNR